METNRRPSRKPYLITALFAVVILVPALDGFGKKFYEFVVIYRSEEGSFALVPILNYLLASAGFFLVIAWAALRGMFRDIEAPKFTMLADEEYLDRYESLPKETHRADDPNL
jgi:hypothetical protein